MGRTLGSPVRSTGADQVSYSRPSYGALWPTRWRGNDVLLTSSTPKMGALLEAAGKDTQRRDQGKFMYRLLIVGILIISTMPLAAQGQQPDPAKVKADAQKVISIISGDKAKTQSYCQIAIVGEQMNQAAQAKDKKKFDELAPKLRELEKNLGPEYLGLVESLGKMNLPPKENDRPRRREAAMRMVCHSPVLANGLIVFRATEPRTKGLQLAARNGS